MCSTPRSAEESDAAEVGVEGAENTNLHNTQPYLKYASRSQLSSSPCIFVSFSPPHMSIAAAEKSQKYTQLVTIRF